VIPFIITLQKVGYYHEHMRISKRKRNFVGEINLPMRLEISLSELDGCGILKLGLII